MAHIGDFVEPVAPVSFDTLGGVIFDRFLAEPNTLAIAVVDAENRPLGLIERNAFTLRMAAEFGRALYARRSAEALMDPAARIADASTSADVFFQSYGAAELGALLGGFIVVRDGRYVGVGTALHVLQAGSALYRQRAEEMGELARDLAVAEAEATASSRAKSEFLAVMSHEIRTPLNGVLGVAALMERKLEQEELRPYVRTILDSGQSLLRLLTDALDMSRAGAGMMTLDIEPVDLVALGGDLDRLWRARADEKALRFEVLTAVEDQDWVMVDGMRLKQLLNNLIGNALKFTEAGGVTVSLAATSHTGRVALEMIVDDTGPGVPEAAAANIFQPFNTGAASRSGAGAGLGLAICRQIAESMDGSIVLERAPGGGARFRAVVSLDRADPERTREDRAAPTAHPTVHVLVVDDNATNRFVACNLLEMFGATSETAQNGREAVEAARVGAFDLILMDIKMPVMDGVQATSAIRALPGPVARIPIVALTANADERDAQTYLAAGMNGVVSKPIQPDLLLDVIRRALSDEGEPDTGVAEAA
jgi:signal transduction histidine kinase/ActR/RegA family two-component response regulator